MSNLPLLVSFTHWKGVWQWGNRTGIRLNLSWYGRHTVIRQIPLTVRWWGHKSLDLHSIPVSRTNAPKSCFIASFDNYKRVKTRWTCQRLSDAIVRKKVHNVSVLKRLLDLRAGKQTPLEQFAFTFVFLSALITDMTYSVCSVTAQSTSEHSEAAFSLWALHPWNKPPDYPRSVKLSARFNRGPETLLSTVAFQ